jgi:hypothetical protein
VVGIGDGERREDAEGEVKTGYCWAGWREGRGVRPTARDEVDWWDGPSSSTATLWRISGSLMGSNLTD